MLRDLQILVSLSESSYLPVSIDRLCDDVLSLVSANLYLFSEMRFKYFSVSKLCLNLAYASNRDELLISVHHFCLYVSIILCFIVKNGICNSFCERQTYPRPCCSRIFLICHAQFVSL